MAKRFWIETLGCPKNQVDSDKIAGSLLLDGYTPADNAEEAELVVVNTCAFIEPAREESVETILGYGQKEMIGKSDIDKVHPDYRDSFRDLFKRMIANPDQRAMVQYEYKAKDGSYIWIE